SELFSKVFLPLEMTRRITSTIKAVNDLKLKVDALSLSLITAGSNFASIGVLDAQQKLGGITDLEAEIRRMRSKAAAEINKITSETTMGISEITSHWTSHTPIIRGVLGVESDIEMMRRQSSATIATINNNLERQIDR